MKNTLHLLLLSIFLNSIYAQSLEQDSLHLVEIYNTFNGPNWQGMENWLSDAPLAEWQGVGINNSTNRVHSLQIVNTQAKSNFPVAVYSLDQLKTLEFKFCQILDGFPTGLIELPLLDRIILQSCQITGDIPSNISEMNQLKTLSISDNELSGSLPNLPPNIFLFNCQNNKFSGTIPTQWSELTELKSLNLNYNELEGNFDLLQNISSLSSIDLADNNWEEMPFPEWLDDMPNARRFFCKECNLTGDIGEGVNITESQIANMALNNNNLSGDISRLLHHQGSDIVQYFDFRGNNFSGEFPTNILGKVNRIDVQDNHFTSISPLESNLVDNINISSNHLTFTSLTPIIDYTSADSIFQYKNQANLLDTDTILINENTSITLLAGDNHSDNIYQWYNNNQVIEGATNYELMLDIDFSSASVSNYHCKISNPNFPQLELKRNTVRVLVDIPTSSTEELSNKISIYPNPSTDYLIIDSQERHQDIRIMNSHGKVIHIPQSQNNKIDITELEAGLYYLWIDSRAIPFTKI